MSTIGCVIFKMGLMLCQPGDRFIETYVAGGPPARHQEYTESWLKDGSSHHQSVWGNLTAEKLEAAFADWGPRRYIPIDWSKVRGVKP